MDCPYEDYEPPAPASFAKRLFQLILQALGAHGIVFLFASVFIILGLIKLSFGRVLFCRKTKAQEMADKMGGDPSSKDGMLPRVVINLSHRLYVGPLLVRCTGLCRGALAAKARYRRKLARLRRMGRKPRHLDDWMNYSYTCNCQFE